MFEHDKAISPALRAAWRQLAKKHLHRPDVQGVSIGYRWKGGRRLKQLCVRIHVTEKVPRRALSAALRLPGKHRSVLVDVVDGALVPQASACPTYAMRTSRIATLQPGFSVGPTDGEAGTLGALVRDDAGTIYLLSARHVLYQPGARTGDPVVQPARPDGGRPEDVVATLAGYASSFDAAVALVNDQRPLRPLALDAPKRFSGVRLPKVGDVLEKSGRSTCVSQAYVDAVGAYQNFSFAMHLRPMDDDPDAQICAPGDSGAVWYDPATGEAVGLHVLGDNIDGTSAVATMLASPPGSPGALESMKVTLV